MRSGQALLVVVLAVAVVLTIGLAIANRSVTEVNVSTIQEEAAKAQAAAEAGLEKALVSAAGGEADITVGSTGGNYTYTSTAVGGSGALDYPEAIKAGEVATFKLDSGFKNKTVTVYWGQSGDPKPAMEAILYNGSATLSQWAYDPDNSRSSNGFSAVVGGGTVAGGRKYEYSASLMMPVITSDVFLGVRLLYSGSVGHYVRVEAPVNFPTQGLNISAAGQSGQSNQAIGAVKMDDDWAPIFDGAVFSGTSLVK